MTAELAHLALLISLGFALLMTALPWISPRAEPLAAARTGIRLAGLHLFFLLLAFGGLVLLFVGNDFSVRNVAQHSSLALPVFYRVTAAWGSHEGSILLWALMGSGWALAALLATGRLPSHEQRHGRLTVSASAWLGAIQSGVLLYLLFTSNPFARLIPVPADGHDLNPLLQDVAMAFHPPLLYLGYVGLAVPFALLLAGLDGQAPSAALARLVRRFALAALAALTLGIGLGSWWAYRELGWGGWWFWDPVENASLIPWLVGIAAAHALLLVERHRVAALMAVLLGVSGFGLSLVGTFIVRSGVITSVHAFATDPTRGTVMLALIVLLVGAALLQITRSGPAASDRLPTGRQALLLVAGVGLLALSAATVLLGTVYPMLVEAVAGERLSVGAPYFDQVFPWLMLPAAALMVLSHSGAWSTRRQAQVRVLLPWAAGVAVAALWWWSHDADSMPGALGQMLAALALVIGTAGVLQSIPALRRRPAMALAHAGLALAVMAIALVRCGEQAVEARLAPGQSIHLGGWSVTLAETREQQGPNFLSTQAVFDVGRRGVASADAVDHAGAAGASAGDMVSAAGSPAPGMTRITGQKRLYAASRQTMTEAAVLSFGHGDLYLSLAERTASGEWIIRVQLKPWINLLWAAAVLMGTGCLWAGVAGASRRITESGRTRSGRERSASTETTQSGIRESGDGDGFEGHPGQAAGLATGSVPAAGGRIRVGPATTG